MTRTTTAPMAARTIWVVIGLLFRRCAKLVQRGMLQRERASLSLGKSTLSNGAFRGFGSRTADRIPTHLLLAIRYG